MAMAVLRCRDARGDRGLGTATLCDDSSLPSKTLCLKDTASQRVPQSGSKCGRRAVRGRRTVHPNTSISTWHSFSTGLSGGSCLAAGETVILLHPPLSLVGVSIGMERGCQ